LTNPTSFYDKALHKLGTEGDFLNLNKVSTKNPTAVPPGSLTRQGCLLLPNICSGDSSQGEEYMYTHTYISIGRQALKLSPFIWVYVYISHYIAYRKFQGMHTHNTQYIPLLELTYKFSKDARSKITIQKLIVFLYTGNAQPENGN
jgi:hypothetical protein